MGHVSNKLDQQRHSMPLSTPARNISSIITMNPTQEIREHILSHYLKGQAPEGFDENYPLIDEGILDSLALMKLIAWLEKRFSIEFGDHDIVPGHFGSVHALAGFIGQKRAVSEDN